MGGPNQPVDPTQNPSRERRNNNRINLYNRLIPEIQRQDALSGAQGPVFHWDDPTATWDELLTNKMALDAVWDSIGLDPLYQELFWVLENMEGEDLTVLESLDAIVDPLTCPVGLLPQLALCYGYQLAAGLTEEAQRVALLGLVDAFHSRGTRISFKVFYRLAGFEIINIYPLFKMHINEALGEYSRTQFVTTPKTNVPIGPAGRLAYSGAFADTPVQPGTVRFFVAGGVTLRDDGEGNIIGPTTESGTINYRTGYWSFTLAAIAPGAVTASFQQITTEYPYHAARIDIDILLSPGGGPIPLITAETVDGLIARMEEVRPIHVLVRNLALVAEIDDTFGADGMSGATDQIGCTQQLVDQRDGLPGPPPTGGRNFNYILDQGNDAEDDLTIEQLVSGLTTLLDKNFDDQAPIVCPMDTLIISTTGNPDQYY
jgi:hypothetical protein